MRTKAAVLWEVNTPWSVEKVRLDPPHANEVQVYLALSGLSHSDDRAAKGGLPVGMPNASGREGTGIVEAVGPGVRRLKPGDHVVP